MKPCKEDTVRRGYKAFGEGDMETFRSIYTPDVSSRADAEGGVLHVMGAHG